MDEAWFLYATEFRNSAKVWPKHSWLITPTHYGRQMKSKWSCSTSLETPNPRCQEIACFPCHFKEVASWGWEFLLVAKPGKFKVGWVAESSNLQDCWMEWWNIFFILAVQGGACDPVDKYHIDPYSQGKNCIVFPSRGGHNYILKPAGRLTHTCDQKVHKVGKTYWDMKRPGKAPLTYVRCSRPETSLLRLVFHCRLSKWPMRSQSDKPWRVPRTRYGSQILPEVLAKVLLRGDGQHQVTNQVTFAKNWTWKLISGVPATNQHIVMVGLIIVQQRRLWLLALFRVTMHSLCKAIFRIKREVSRGRS